MIRFWTALLPVVACLIRLSTGGAAFSFQDCRSPRRTGDQQFALDECPVGQSISIRSAEVGFNYRWDPNDRRSRCSASDVSCERSTQHAEIARCNGQRTCSFGASVLAFPQGSAQRLCRRHRDANFVSVRYQCINGATSSRGAMTMMMVTMSPASAAATNRSTVTEPLPTSAQESTQPFVIGTLSMGEIVGLIVVAGLLLLTLLVFLVIIIICLCKHRREKPSSTKDAAVSTEQHQYQNVGDIEQAGDAVTSPNDYQSLQRHHLHLPELRNAVAAYCQLTG